MTKELEALERIYCHLPQIDGDRFKRDKELIEKTLKEKEQQDDVIKIIKETIEFSQIIPYIEPNKDNGFDIMSAVSINIQRAIENKKRELLRNWILETCFPKELKALKVIKDKMRIEFHEYPDGLFQVVVFPKEQTWIGLGTELYFGNRKEEYDLLKEVLDNEI